MKYLPSLIILWFASLIAGCNSKATQINRFTDPVVSKDEVCIKIDQYMSRIASEKNFSGALLIIKDQKKLICKGYGWANRDKKIPFTNQTLASMGSITKSFTAAAILNLQEEKKLNVNQKLSDFFSSVPDDKKNITIHQLLTHSSGITELLDGDRGDYEKIETEAYIKRAFNQALSFEPGTMSIYTNVGMSLLAIIIEKVSGMEYEQYLQTALFKPAGINSLGYHRTENNNPLIAHGYLNGNDWGTHQTHYNENGGGPYWNLKGNGGLEASLEDIYLWSNALSTASILNDSSLKQMFTPHIEEARTQGFYFFGYGCNISKTRSGKKLIDNGGSNGIYFARMLRFPEENLVMYLVTNDNRAPAEKIMPNVVQLFFKGKIEQDEFENNGNFEFEETATILELCNHLEDGNLENKMKEKNLVIQNDMALLEAGTHLRSINEKQKAKEVFEYYTASFPKIIVAWNELAELEEEDGNKEKARLCYEQVLKIRPDNERALKGLQRIKRS